MESVHQITGEKKIGDGFAVYALNHRVHKLRDYLAAQVWDGVPRVDSLLIDYFGVEDSPYTREGAAGHREEYFLPVSGDGLVFRLAMYL